MSGSGITQEYIDHELRKIYKKMIELFKVNFPYFNDVIIIPKSEAREVLTEKIRLNLEEKGVIYTTSLWEQIQVNFNGEGAGGFFENLAFYDEKKETMYIAQNLLLNHPDRVIPVCVHELAEKLVSTLTPNQSIKASTEKLIERYINSGESNERITFEDISSIFKEVVFRSVFKEGCCEALALRTLSYSGFRDVVAPIEKELLQGHSKLIGILFDIENMTDGIDNYNCSVSLKKDGIATVEDKREPIQTLLKRCQVVKSISYHLGYPIAKEIIDEHGIEGIKIALGNPPLRAEYFVEPSEYVSSLEMKEVERR
jgi:hypothetical protein